MGEEAGAPRVLQGEGTLSEGGGLSRKEGGGGTTAPRGGSGVGGGRGGQRRVQTGREDLYPEKVWPGGPRGLSLFEKQPIKPALLLPPKLSPPGCSALGHWGAGMFPFKHRAQLSGGPRKTHHPRLPLCSPGATEALTAAGTGVLSAAVLVDESVLLPASLNIANRV